MKNTLKLSLCFLKKGISTFVDNVKLALVYFMCFLKHVYINLVFYSFKQDIIS